jgi:hypothetical protein
MSVSIQHSDEEKPCRKVFVYTLDGINAAARKTAAGGTGADLRDPLTDLLSTDRAKTPNPRNHLPAPGARGRGNGASLLPGHQKPHQADYSDDRYAKQRENNNEFGQPNPERPK